MGELDATVSNVGKEILDINGKVAAIDIARNGILDSLVFVLCNELKQR